ncbi:MAG: glycosyltransferase family 39 protein [Candidatus Korobacteraceae bacterium]
MPAASERPLVHPAPQQESVWASVLIRRRVWFLTLVTLAGAGFRLFHLGTKSLWLDEGATVTLARMAWPHFVHVWWYGEASFQGAFFLLMRGWLHLGQSEVWVRLPAAIFGIASIPLIYLVGRKLMGVGPALASAAILAFSPTHVYYSQEARSYTMTILLVLVSSWFLVRAVEQNHERDWALWTVFGALAVYSHYFASLVLVAQACSLFFRKRPAPWGRLIIHGLAILAIAAPGLTYVLRVPPQGMTFPWMPKPTPKQLLHLALFLGGSGEKFLLAMILWSAGVIAIRRDRSGESTPGSYWRGMLVISWAVVPVLLTALVSLRHPVFVQRYMIFSLPATVMLAGRGMSALPKKRIGFWLVVALCVTSIPTLILGYRKPREDWRSATNVILASAQPGDAVVIYPFYAIVGFDYYRQLDPHAPALHLFTQPYYGVGDNDRTLLKALSSGSPEFHHVWVMIRREGPGRDDLQDDSPAVAAKLQSVFGTPAVWQFKDITVLKFGRR